jgi:hypothetical protein
MQLRDGGMDIFYIDESHDNKFYVVTAIAVPFLRKNRDGWTIAWDDHFKQARQWRRALKSNFDIPTSKELHGVKLASGRGNFLKGKYNFSRARASRVYRDILSAVDFLPNASVISCAARRPAFLYGGERLEAAMHALFQRIRSQCNGRNVNAIVFFDQGHPEYRKLYRKAQVYLPTGSQFGGWMGQGQTRNLPLDMFTKDANEKNSKHCFFTQLADLIAYAAFLKIKNEGSLLTDWQQQYKLGNLYDSIPSALLNLRASRVPPRDGIVRLTK